MRRNKIPFLIPVFIFALLFILGILGEGRHWRCAPQLFWGGQTGFALSLIIFFLVPSKERE